VWLVKPLTEWMKRILQVRALCQRGQPRLPADGWHQRNRGRRSAEGIAQGMPSQSGKWRPDFQCANRTLRPNTAMKAIAATQAATASGQFLRMGSGSAAGP